MTGEHILALVVIGVAVGAIAIWRRVQRVDPTRCLTCGTRLAEGELSECQDCWESRAW